MNNPRPEESPLFELRQVSLTYGRNRVVDNIDLAIHENELVCLLGPSGCGKTSTLRIASGVERQTSGTVWFDGRQISGPKRHDPPETRQIGLMFQDFALFPHMTILANVGFGLKKLDRTERHRRSQDALERMGIGHLAAAYPHMLSGGEQQRVALCRALAPKPRIMLMDEPFSGLDRGLRNAVREDTRRTLRAEGASGLLVTHDADEALRLADRIVLMRGGKFVQIGSPADIYDRPIDLESAELFSEINKLPAIVENGAAVTPLGNFAAPGFHNGARVTLALRYSDFRIAADDAGEECPSCYRFSAKVKNTRFLGRDSLVDFTGVDDERLFRARVTDIVEAGPQDLVTLQISTDKVLIFAEN